MQKSTAETALKHAEHAERAEPESPRRGPVTGHRPGTRRRAAAVAACVVVLGLAGTACSDGDGSDGKDDAAASDTGKTDEDKAVAYRKCLRDNGMDISEPKPGKKKEAVTVDGGNKATMEKAFKACKDKAPNGGPGGEPSQADKDKAIKFAKCMRENGWNMPDPKFEEGAARAMPAPKTAAEKKKFEKANKACGGEFR